MDEKKYRFIGQIRKVGKSLYVLIPKEVADFLNLKPKQLLYLEVQEVREGEKSDKRE